MQKQYTQEYIKAHSKIYQIMRNKYDRERDGNLDVSMSVRRAMNDIPASYTMLLFNRYQIIFESCNKGIFMYRQYKNADNRSYYKVFSVGLKDTAKIFKGYTTYNIERKTLAQLANRDWRITTSNQSDINIELISIMHHKYIKTLLYYNIIKYDTTQNKYIAVE